MQILPQTWLNSPASPLLVLANLDWNTNACKQLDLLQYMELFKDCDKTDLQQWCTSIPTSMW